MESDLALLERWRRGAASAGSVLFDRHFDGIYRFFKHKVAGDPADLVQRTFLSCLESRDSFRGDASFRSFLFGIAKNELLLHFRAKKRAADGEIGPSSLEDFAPSASALLALGQDENLLLKALRSIPLELQIALELHYWEALSGPELAVVLQIPEGTVRSRLRRAREAVRERIRELESSNAALDSTLSDLDGWAASLRNLRDALAEL